MNEIRPLYMDNAATSYPKPLTVWQAMQRYASACGASPGRGGYRQAREITAIIGECRQRIAELINAPSSDMIAFTSNCTEAINTALYGLIDPKEGGHAICTHSDHNSILRPIQMMVDRGWITQTRVPIDPISGKVNPQDIAAAIRPDTRLIALTHGSNVTGAVQPLREISAVAHAAHVPLIVDVAQTIGHWPIDVMADGIDLLAAPGHKALLGPPGTGFLYVSPAWADRVGSLKQGGTGSQSELPRQPDMMPDRFESGSLNAIGIAGLLEGLKWVQSQTIESLGVHQTELIKTFLEGVGDIVGLSIYGPLTAHDRLGVFSVRLQGVSPQTLADQLENEFGILTRAGLHCAPLVHRAIGTADIGGTTRFSFGAFNSMPDVQYATDALAAIAMRETSSISVN